MNEMGVGKDGTGNIYCGEMDGGKIYKEGRRDNYEGLSREGELDGLTCVEHGGAGVHIWGGEEKHT